MSSVFTRLKIALGSSNADEHALSQLPSDGYVVVGQGTDLIFEPTNKQPDTGVILYPGGRCDARAYAPIMRAVAAAGYLTIIPNMPLRMAVLDAKRAQKIMSAHAHIKKWVLGGHSMGGAMAAGFAYKNIERLSGLFFVGSYAANMHAMPDSPLPTLMIHGTHDFVTRKSEFDAQADRLPAHTIYKAIEGGDHYQFGSFKNVEVTATISRDEQQNQTVQALLAFLNNLKS